MSTWMSYVKQVQKDNNLTYHQALTVASKSWRAEKNGSPVDVKDKPSPIPDKSKEVKVDEALPKRKREPKKVPTKRVTKAQKQQMEIEQLRLKAELAEARAQLAGKKVKKNKKSRKSESDSSD